jgi:hypothetical protein
LSKGVRGSIIVPRGDPQQKSDIEVQLISRFNDTSNLVKTWFEFPASGVNIAYNSSKNSSSTEVEIIVVLRPFLKHTSNVFELRTEILDIIVQEPIGWKVKNLMTHSSHSNTDYYWSSDQLVTHNVTASSVSDEIYGYYPADAHMNIRNEKGKIEIFLVQYYNRQSLGELKSIVVENVNGDIHVEMMLELFYPETRHHDTQICSESGKIWATVPHDRLTNISSSSRDVMVIIIPLGADSLEDRNELHTNSASGKEHMQLWGAIVDRDEGPQCNLLRNTRSCHYVGDGSLEIAYPSSWSGNLEARVERGTLYFTSTALERIEKGVNWVKAKPEADGDSFVDIWFGSGLLDIHLGLRDF